MTLSNNLERKDKFDTVLKFFLSLASKPLFFNSGRMTACLNSEGKQPDSDTTFDYSVNFLTVTDELVETHLSIINGQWIVMADVLLRCIHNCIT